MDYNEFKEFIKEYFRDMVGKSCRVEIKTVIKNNDTKLDAITVLGEGEEISPTLYLNDYYRQYNEGRDAEAIAAAMYGTYVEYKAKNDIDISIFSNMDKLKDKVVFKLINKGTNQKLLKNVPYVDFLDLAVVFYIMVETKEFEFATTLIQNNHLKIWGITKDEIIELAKKNTPNKLRADIFGLGEMIKDLISKNGEIDDDGINKFDCDDTGNIFVLTNKYRVNGASCILYEDVVKMFADYVNEDVYIIPSSVHEVILMPQEGNNADSLNEMVREVNMTILEHMEILSDHVYKYERETNRIIMQ